MNPALELLTELEQWLNSFQGLSPYPDELQAFIDYQRSIYGEAVGECAS
jgi:hypothetical protein